MESASSGADGWTRRRFLEFASAAGAVATAPPEAASSASRTAVAASSASGSSPAPPVPSAGLADHPGLAPIGPIVDVNVWLGRWPTRRLPLDDPARLVDRLRARGVVRAWAGTFDGLLHKDLRAANDRLARECREFGDGLLLPFGTIHPGLPGWREELARCREVHGMRGVRLHPDYHGIPPDDPRTAEALHRVAEAGLIVQMAMQMEDERMMHPRLRVEPAKVGSLAEVVRGVPGLRLVLLNASRATRPDELGPLLASGEVYLELSGAEGIGAAGRLLGSAPASRVLFGSRAPLFVWEAARLALHESALDDATRASVAHGAADRLLG